MLLYLNTLAQPRYGLGIGLLYSNENAIIHYQPDGVSLPVRILFLIGSTYFPL